MGLLCNGGLRSWGYRLVAAARWVLRASKRAHARARVCACVRVRLCWGGGGAWGNKKGEGMGALRVGRQECAETRKEAGGTVTVGDLLIVFGSLARG